jgi:hypothetical protein
MVFASPGFSETSYWWYILVVLAGGVTVTVAIDGG